MKVVRNIAGMGIIGVLIIGAFWGTIHARNVSAMGTYNIDKAINEVKLAPTSNQLIRFHVLANSDSELDQALKRAVRDAILKDVSPLLAVSQSLDESRQILKKVRPDMERIGRSVVKMWGKDYSVRTEYGTFPFPTKSYGSLVLAAGDYEALRVVIGKGQGSNWWCVLFPPLCFVNIEESTAVQVDGKQGIPIKNTLEKSTAVQVDGIGKRVIPIKKDIKQTASTTTSSIVAPSTSTPKVRFYFWEKITNFFKTFNSTQV